MLKVPSVLQVTTLGTWGLMHGIQKFFLLETDKNISSFDWLMKSYEVKYRLIHDD